MERLSRELEDRPWMRHSSQAAAVATEAALNGAAAAAAKSTHRPEQADSESDPGMDSGMDPGMDPGIDPGMDPGMDYHTASQGRAIQRQDRLRHLPPVHWPDHSDSDGDDHHDADTGQTALRLSPSQ